MQSLKLCKDRTMSEFIPPERKSEESGSLDAFNNGLGKVRQSKRRTGFAIGAALGVLAAIASLGSSVTVMDLLAGGVATGFLGWGIGLLIEKMTTIAAVVKTNPISPIDKQKSRQFLPIAGAIVAVLFFLYLFVPRDGLGGSSVFSYTISEIDTSETSPEYQVGYRCEDRSGKLVGPVATLIGGSEGKQMCESDGNIWRSFFVEPYSYDSNYSVSELVSSDLEDYSLGIFLLVGCSIIGGYTYSGLAKRQRKEQ